jgi:hypothetical protein
MTRRFLVAVEGMAAPEEEQFIAYIRKEGMGWWHWIANIWLLVDERDTITARIIRDKLSEIAKPSRCLILEVDPVTWSGVRNDPKMFDWMTRAWKKD